MAVVFPLFWFLFVVALPGRTTFVTLLMASRGKPFAVFLGASLAFTVHCVISVLLGGLLGFLPQVAVHAGAGALFLFFAWKAWRESGQEGADSREPSLGAAFAVVFAAEWGDVSQLAIATASAQFADRGAVFVAAVAALWLTALLAATAGSLFGKLGSPKVLQRVAAGGFAVTGAYLLLHAALELAR